jgi:hypothetical protein
VGFDRNDIHSSYHFVVRRQSGSLEGSEPSIVRCLPRSAPAGSATVWMRLGHRSSTSNNFFHFVCDVSKVFRKNEKLESLPTYRQGIAIGAKGNFDLPEGRETFFTAINGILSPCW